MVVRFVTRSIPDTKGIARPGQPWSNRRNRENTATTNLKDRHVCVSDGVFTDASTGRVEFVPAYEKFSQFTQPSNASKQSF